MLRHARTVRWCRVIIADRRRADVDILSERFRPIFAYSVSSKQGWWQQEYFFKASFRFLLFASSLRVHCSVLRHAVASVSVAVSLQSSSRRLRCRYDTTMCVYSSVVCTVTSIRALSLSKQRKLVHRLYIDAAHVYKLNLPVHGDDCVAFCSLANVTDGTLLRRACRVSFDANDCVACG